MYDTLHLLIQRANLSAIEAHDALEAEGVKIYSKQFNDTGKLSYFKYEAEALKNLTGYYGAKGFVIYGSLPKYYFGENVSTLTITQTKLALERLEWELGLPLLQYGIVKRLDVAFTFAVQNTAAEYLQAMQSYDKGKFNHIGNKAKLETVRYDFGKNQSLNCYNKQLESNFIPPNYTGKNLLRIEMQIKGGIQYLPISELWEPATYEKYIVQYCNLFHKMKFKDNAQTLKPIAGLTAVENLHYLAYKEYCSNPDYAETCEFKNRNAKADFKSFINKGRQYAIQSDTAHSLSDELKGCIKPEKLLAQIAPSANNEALEADYSTNF